MTVQVQQFEGHLTWSCLGNWFYPKDTAGQAYALILGKITLKAFPELVVPNKPFAKAASFDVELEGLIFKDQAIIPKAPCDWKTWPGFDKTQSVACIRVAQILKLAKRK